MCYLFQGLLIYDGEGNVIFSRELEEDVVLSGIAIAAELGTWSAAPMHRMVAMSHAGSDFPCSANLHQSDNPVHPLRPLPLLLPLPLTLNMALPPSDTTNPIHI